MDSGIFWEAKTHDSSHAISWHDVVVPELGNYRVWVHAIGSGLLNDFVDQSKSRVDVRMQFKIAGMEVEAHGDKFLPVSSDEKMARLKVASLRKDVPSQGFRAALFRELPYSKIEAEHLKCMRACRIKIEEEFRKPLRLSAVDSVSTIIFKEGKSGSPFEKAIRNRLEIDSTKAHSIAIAMIYSELSKSGSSNIVKQICIDLDVESKTIYAALRVARSQGWLTASGKGKSGGTLTKMGEKSFKELNGDITLRDWLSRGSGGTK
jgi:hypothetical protein